MRVLVTGGAGFQGSNLSKSLLRNDHDVTILNTLSERSQANLTVFDLRQASVVWGSVTDPDVVNKTIREHDVVVHLAANIHVDESRNSPREYITTNVGGTLNVLEACRKYRIPLLHISTCEVYGSSPDPISEKNPLFPQSPYAASKAGADTLVYSYAMTYKLPVIIARPSNVYGFGQRSGARGAVIPKMFNKAIGGDPITIYGDGSQTRDFIYIKDLVKAYRLLLYRVTEGHHTEKTLFGMGRSNPEVYNIGTGIQTSIASLATTINRITGYSGPINISAPRPGEVQSFCLNSDAIRNIGFVPRYSLQDGLAGYSEKTYSVCS